MRLSMHKDLCLFREKSQNMDSNLDLGFEWNSPVFLIYASATDVGDICEEEAVQKNQSIDPMCN